MGVDIVIVAGAQLVELVEALAWPATVLLLVGGLLLWPRAQSGANAFFRQFRRVKMPWLEFELTEEGAREARAITLESFTAYREKIRAEYDRQVAAFAVAERLGRLVQDFVAPSLTPEGIARPSFRCTLHVSDVLFTETMYQLVDYYPRGGGRGRTFSERFGIVGRAWRLNEPAFDSNVSTNPRDLVQQWGMTYKEATASGEGRRSFAAIPLKDAGGIRLGVVYLDSQEGGLFGMTGEGGRADEVADRIITAVTNGVHRTGLLDALNQLVAELRRRGPAIPLHEVGR